MAATREGGIKAAATNKLNNPNFYVINGAKGGAWKSPHKGFGSDPAKASYYGRIGGSISRRGGSKLDNKERMTVYKKLEKQGYKLKRTDYLKEQADDNRAKLSKLNEKYGVRRPW